MISAFYPPDAFGGDAIFIQNLNRELLRRGHEVDVIYCADPYNSLKGGGEARFAELEGGPQILQMSAPAGALKLYTAHEHWLVCPLSVLWKDNREVCHEPACFTCSVRAGRPPQLWRRTNLLTQSAAYIDGFLALSEASAAAHRQRGFRQKMRVLPGFAALPVEAKTVSPHPRPYFLFVGRLEKYKGVQDAISSIPLGSSYDLLIAGAGRYEPELRRLAESRPNVHLVGWKGPDELSPYYKHARALIAPSLTLETFGMVVAEAMAHGTPVIARDLGPYPELLAAGGGLLFRDRSQLAAAIRRLGDDDEQRTTLGAQALASYRAERTPEIYVDRYLATVDEIRSIKSKRR